MKPFLAAIAVVAAGVGAGVTRADAPQTPPQRVVVRTELVRANDGFDWLDAATGFGVAMASVAVVLLLVTGHRTGGLKATHRKDA
jgi:hypothetical protein